MLRYLTAGESHGKCLVAILEGVIAGLKIDKDFIDNELFRRQQGVGRSERMKIEKDRVEILSGIRKNLTIGGPIALMIENRDFSIDSLPPVVCPRPGHADLAGGLKYGAKDLRDVLERASARETASRVAVGAVCKLLLDEFGITVSSRVVTIGGALANSKDAMIKMVESARKKGDTVGGIFEITAEGVPAGLGSFTQPEKRLNARLAGALMSIQAIKAVELGLGFESARCLGSEAHDEIFYEKSKGFYRKSNNAGGIEGGISNGQPIVARCAMKPIPTLTLPLASVDIKTKMPAKAAAERSDICAVPSAAIVGEAVVAFQLADAILEKFGGDSLTETRRNYEGYIKQVNAY